MAGQEDQENIGEIYLTTTRAPGNIENENGAEREKNNDESEPDISRLVAVKIPIINLSDADSEKTVITQTTETSTTTEADSSSSTEPDISSLVGVKIPIIDLSNSDSDHQILKTVVTTETTTPTTTLDSSIILTNIPIQPVQAPIEQQTTSTEASSSTTTAL